MYVDLERMIQDCSFSPRELSVLNAFMEGYTSSDICEEFGVTRQTVDTFFKRAVAKIVSCNNENWERVYSTTR